MDDLEPLIRPTQVYLSSWNNYNRDMNKENRPIPDRTQASTGKRRMFDHQENTSYGPNYISVSSSHKRQRRDVSDDIQDAGFEYDPRIPNPDRRRTAPIPQAYSSPPEMVRGQHSGECEALTGRHNRERIQTPSKSSNAATRDDDWIEEDEDEDDDKDGVSDAPRPPTYPEVNASARYAAVRSTQSTYRTQRRTPWSEADTNHLIELIGKHSTRWSIIQSEGTFEVKRDQVALKDKARNIKATYLK
jgi:hypothetical protein